MMTKPSPLKTSPLRIEHHEFRAIRVEATAEETAQGPMSLRTVRNIERHPEKDRRWKVELTVEFGNSDESNKAPYSGSISAAGWFVVAEAYPQEKQEMLIEITAASILYGACREMVASFTARSSHGMMSLPSVTFPPIEPPSTSSPEIPSAEKTGRKVGRKAKPSS